MWDFVTKMFGRDSEGSKETAKERLRLVLVHDRSSVSPHLLESLKEELIQVISKYMDIDVTGLEVNLERSEESVALVANIPIRKVRRLAER